MKPDIVNLLRFLILQSTAASKTPIEILHKYLIRNEDYAEFFALVNRALPSDVFGDDDWIKDFAKSIKNKDDKEKFEELINSFADLRTFIRKNKMFNQLVCGYPDPDMDSKIIERLLSERKDIKPQR